MRTVPHSPQIVLLMPPSNCVNDDRLEAPLGLLYIAAVLRESNYQNLSIFDMSGCKDEQEIAAAIQRIPWADVYGLTVFCSNHWYAKRCVERIRDINPEALIVAGGPNPSALPELTVQDLSVDAVIRGEGEDALVTLLTGLQAAAPFEKIIAGRGRENIDSYPFPARDLVNLASYNKLLLGKPTVSMITARGCVNNCLHCNSNVMGGGNTTPRYRSTENILKEIGQLCDQSFTRIRFSDDNFTANPDLLSLLARLPDYGIHFRVFARIEQLTEPICRALKAAGCAHVAVGLESLNPDNLKVLGKASQTGKQENIRIAKECGLIIRASFMVGLPYDTDETITRYFDLAAALPFDEFEVYPLIPFPGTRIARTAEKWGYEIIDPDFTSYVLVGKNRRTTFALKHRNFSPEDVIRWRAYAETVLQSKGKAFMKDSKIAQ